MSEEINYAKFAMLVRQEFQLCTVQKGETIILLSDPRVRRDFISVRDCTVTLDNDVIIYRGRFTDDKMRGARCSDKWGMPQA